MLRNSIVAVSVLDVLAAETHRPNFIFMLADDWGWGDVGAYRPGGSFPLTGTYAQTPTLDALAANGTLFTDFHTGQSFCAPSRTCFMTGRYPADLGVNVNWNEGAKGAEQNHENGLPYQVPLPSGEGASPYPGGLPNIAHVMQQAGYATGHFGKWHLGGVSPEGQHTPKPSEYGFDITATYGSAIGALPHLADEKNWNLHDGKLVDGTWWSADVDGVISDLGVQFMQNSTARGVPFYLHLWFHSSHDTLDPRPEQLEDFPFKDTCLFPAKQLGQTVCSSQVFWAAQTYADKHHFARVINTVDDMGIRDRTYIIFSTDNGAQTREYHTGANAFDNAVGSNGPFRGSKASLYDGGHRVPFIVTGPGVPKGRVDHSLLSAADWIPTISKLAGATIPAGTMLRGHDVSDIWTGKHRHVTNRDQPLFWRAHSSPGRCWNLSPALAARNGDWKLLMNPDYATGGPYPRVELYNISVKARAFFEAQNEAEAHPEVVAALSKPLLAWHAEVGPAKPGLTDAQLSKGAQGCESYPFPGADDTAVEDFRV